MFDALVVLWLGSSPELAQNHADVAAWAASRDYTPTAPTAAPVPAYDAALAERIEALLEEARSAPEVGVDALEPIEALLTEHPELPQAAWLLAERYAIEAHALAARGEATRARARDLLERSRQLEGDRASPLGLPPLPALPPGVNGASSPARPALVLAGARPHDRLFVDGVEAAAPGPGRHHVQLYRGSQRVWVGWVDSAVTSELPVDPSAACSALDLADVEVEADAPHPAPGVRCGRWLAARATPVGGTELSECAGSGCGPWRRAAVEHAAASSAAAGAERADWPAWATWGLAGAGVLGATGIVLWQAGVFDRSTPGTEFVFTGPSASGYRF